MALQTTLCFLFGFLQTKKNWCFFLVFLDFSSFWGKFSRCFLGFAEF